MGAGQDELHGRGRSWRGYNCGSASAGMVGAGARAEEVGGGGGGGNVLCCCKGPRIYNYHRHVDVVGLGRGSGIGMVGNGR